MLSITDIAATRREDPLAYGLERPTGSRKSDARASYGGDD